MSRRMARTGVSSKSGTPVTLLESVVECSAAPSRQAYSFGPRRCRYSEASSRTCLEQANRPDPTVAAEIKPVERPAGHAYQVASFHLNRHHRSLRRMNVEQPASGDDVTHFVFIMGVFDVELRQHGIEPGSVSVHVNHIRRDIPAPALAFFKLRSVCAQHLLRRSILRQIRRSLPANL